MTDTTDLHSTPRGATPARDWVKTLAGYRNPNQLRSAFELGATIIPFVILWALAWWSLSVSYWLAFGISLFNAACDSSR